MEKRKDYLFKIAIAYLETLEKNTDALKATIRYDGALCDGSCLLEDMKMEIDEIENKT